MAFDDNRNLVGLVCFLLLIYFIGTIDIFKLLMIILLIAIIMYVMYNARATKMMGNITHYFGECVHNVGNTLDTVNEE